MARLHAVTHKYSVFETLELTKFGEDEIKRTYIFVVSQWPS